MSAAGSRTTDQVALSVAELALVSLADSTEVFPAVKFRAAVNGAAVRRAGGNATAEALGREVIVKLSRGVDLKLC
jgi:hypothetical protein